MTELLAEEALRELGTAGWRIEIDKSQSAYSALLISPAGRIVGGVGGPTPPETVGALLPLIADLRRAVRNSSGFTVTEERMAAAEAPGLCSVDLDRTGRRVIAGWDGEAWFDTTGDRVTRVGQFTGPVQVRWAGRTLAMMGNRGTRQIIMLLDQHLGSVLAEWELEWVAHDFLASRDWIVTLHGDQSGVPVDTNGGTLDDRLAVWDLAGELQTSYPVRAGREGEDVLDVSAACWVDLHSVAFMPCCSFHLVRFDVATNVASSYPTSPLVHGATVLTFDGTRAIALIDGDVWVWDVSGDQLTCVGTMVGDQVRPGPHGELLSIRGSEAWLTRVAQ